MSLANNNGKVARPINVGSWRTILVYAQGALQSCGASYHHSGGLQIVGLQGLFFDENAGCLGLTPNIELWRYQVVYIYSAGSPFETVLNEYMTSGEGLDPYNIKGASSAGWANSSTRVVLPGFTPAVM
jgi:hypothetical protein